MRELLDATAMAGAGNGGLPEGPGATTGNGGGFGTPGAALAGGGALGEGGADAAAGTPDGAGAATGAFGLSLNFPASAANPSKQRSRQDPRIWTKKRKEM